MILSCSYLVLTKIVEYFLCIKGFTYLHSIDNLSLFTTCSINSNSLIFLLFFNASICILALLLSLINLSLWEILSVIKLAFTLSQLLVLLNVINLCNLSYYHFLQGSDFVLSILLLAFQIELHLIHRLHLRKQILFAVLLKLEQYIFYCISLNNVI